MTVFAPHEHNRTLRRHRGAQTVDLMLSDVDGSATKLVEQAFGKYSFRLTPTPVASAIAPHAIAGSAAAVVEVAADDPKSVERFQQLAATGETPLIAAVYEPPLALVRTLIRSGACDVLALPLDLPELDAALAEIERQVGRKSQAEAERGRLVSVIKSGGGVGATALLTQLSVMYAKREADEGRETCLVDLDLQFGDAAFQLGLRPGLSVASLLEASSRLDGALLQSAAVTHPSGLRVIGAPHEMMPLDSVSCDQLLEVVLQAQKVYGTVFLDLPANWTDWSISLVVRSDLVLLVTELSVPCLRQVRRQLDLLASQDAGDIDLRILVNRHEDRLFKTIKPSDVRRALGRDVNYTVSSDARLMRATIDQGQPIAELARRSAVVKDLDKVAADVWRHLRQGR